MAEDRRHASARPHPRARITGLALGLVLAVTYAQAAEQFQRLSAREIRAQIIGKVVTDEAHWSQHFHPDGTLQSIVVSQLRQGTWKIKGHTLCLTLKTRKQETTTECYEVWRWKDHIEYRDNGATVMTGFVRQERRSAGHPPPQSRPASRGGAMTRLLALPALEALHSLTVDG